MEKPKRPSVVPGMTKKVETSQCGPLLVIVNLPWEIFCRMGNPGGCQNSWGEALARSISVGLRNGVPVEEYIEQLKDIKCSCPSPKGLPAPHSFLSCPDSIARVLLEALAPKNNGGEAEYGTSNNKSNETTA